eukprot:TRINITY_DN2934_c0_g1_i1.p1 TRINITY_DN2934_c0_g1~~TRINITY_DN2934_c0_g1_i1.p1  ORF type:complete len:376 (+),score=73.96 TRINITY_DN2934_c0_g1_i1:86-1213(+)
MGDDSSNIIPIKVRLNDEIRRFSVAKSADSFNSLMQTIASIFFGGKMPRILVKYEDEDKDMVTMSSNEEFLEAARCNSPGGVLRLVLYDLSAPTPAPVPTAVQAVVPSPYSAVIHQGVGCGLCGTSPIVGARFKCMTCTDFNMCAGCEGKAEHDPRHPLIKMTVSSMSAIAPLIPVPRTVPVLTAAPTSVIAAAAAASLEPIVPIGNLTQISHAPYRPPHLRAMDAAAPAFDPTQMTMMTAGAAEKEKKRRERKEKTLQARLVRHDSVAPGAEVAAGSTFTKVWVLRNDGAVKWDSTYRLIHVGGDAFRNVSDDSPAVAGVVPVTAPGEECSIAVSMYAPLQPGRYLGYWRMMSPNAEKRFGQRVCCDVLVVERK